MRHCSCAVCHNFQLPVCIFDDSLSDTSHTGVFQKLGFPSEESDDEEEQNGDHQEEQEDYPGIESDNEFEEFCSRATLDQSKEELLATLEREKSLKQNLSTIEREFRYVRSQFKLKRWAYYSRKEHSNRPSRQDVQVKENIMLKKKRELTQARLNIMIAQTRKLSWRARICDLIIKYDQNKSSRRNNKK
jgi:hypothetical protein